MNSGWVYIANTASKMTNTTAHSITCCQRRKRGAEGDGVWGVMLGILSKCCRLALQRGFAHWQVDQRCKDA